MPFAKASNDPTDPDVLLEQVGPNKWCLREGFVYIDRDRVFPIRAGTETDLASVKWPLWWLIASYGRHTKAVLLHDELIGPADDYPMKVKRREADRLLFVALGESGFGSPEKRKRPSWVRRWFIWAAVAVIGTMGSQALLRTFLFLAHVLLFWTLVGVAAFDRWFGNVGSIGALDWWPLNLAESIAVVAVAGLFWAFDPVVDTYLGLGLFPAAAAAVLIAVPPAVFAICAVAVVAAGDLVYNFGAAIRERDFSLGRLIPIITPFRHRGRF